MQKRRSKVRWWHVALGMLRVLAVAYLSLLLLAMIFEERLIFLPSKYPQGDWAPGIEGVEDVFVTAEDGTQCHAWYLPHKDPIAHVLFLHGNAGNITHRTPLMLEMNRTAGVSILMLDYRGYGRSEGKPTEAGVLQDARAARSWLANRAGIAESEVVLMGRSLGGAVAIDLAADGGAAALILQSTFTSMADVAAVHYPFLPVRWAMGTKFDSKSKIAQYDGPLLMSHGDSDNIIPFRHGEELFAASASEDKYLMTLPGGFHNDADSPAYLVAVRDFLQRVTGP